MGSVLHAISISTNKSIGRIDLISSIVRSCHEENCPICEKIKKSARFLSKNMFTFVSQPSNKYDCVEEKEGKELGKITFQASSKGYKLIRINDKRIQDGLAYDMINGNIITILLPNDTSFRTNRNYEGSSYQQGIDDRLMIKFTFLVDEKIQSQHKESSGLESSLEDSPASELAMPQQFYLENYGQSNSFESSISAGGMIESNISNDAHLAEMHQSSKSVLLSSLSSIELRKLQDKCGKSPKDQFRRKLLKLMDGGKTPALLKSTRAPIE